MKNILKLLLSIPLFVILTYIYCMLVILILMLPVFIGDNQEVMSSGIWAYFLIIGITVGGVLSFFSTKKILFTKKNNVIKDERTDKLLYSFFMIHKEYNLRECYGVQ